MAPNLISLFRMASSIPIGLLLFYNLPSLKILTLLWVLAAGLSDLFDGWLARIKKSQSKVGEYLDILADHSLVLACWSALGWQYLKTTFFFLISAEIVLIALGSWHLITLLKEKRETPLVHYRFKKTGKFFLMLALLVFWVSEYSLSSILTVLLEIYSGLVASATIFFTLEISLKNQER